MYVTLCQAPNGIGDKFGRVTFGSSALFSEEMKISSYVVMQVLKGAVAHTSWLQAPHVMA